MCVQHNRCLDNCVHQEKKVQTVVFNRIEVLIVTCLKGLKFRQLFVQQGRSLHCCVFNRIDV